MLKIIRSVFALFVPLDAHVRTTAEQPTHQDYQIEFARLRALCEDLRPNTARPFLAVRDLPSVDTGGKNTRSRSALFAPFGALGCCPIKYRWNYSA